MATVKEETNLSHAEALSALKVIPLEKHFADMTEAEMAVVKHYSNCKECRDQGLEKIRGLVLDHKEAILFWARHPFAIWQDIGRWESLSDVMAVEHVWGRYDLKNSQGGIGWDHNEACHNSSCRKVLYYWGSIPMSSHSDGPEGPQQLFSLLFGIFMKEDWGLAKLVEVQRKRCNELVDATRLGSVDVGYGHYNSIDEVERELWLHISELGDLVISLGAAAEVNKT